MNTAQHWCPCQPWASSWVERITAASLFLFTQAPAFFLSTSYFLWPLSSLSCSLTSSMLRWCEDSPGAQSFGVKDKGMRRTLLEGRRWLNLLQSRSNTPNWQVGGNPEPIYLSRRCLKQWARSDNPVSVDEMMKCTIAAIEWREQGGKQKDVTACVSAGDHVGLIYVWDGHRDIVSGRSFNDLLEGGSRQSRKEDGGGKRRKNKKGDWEKGGMMRE